MTTQLPAQAGLPRRQFIRGFLTIGLASTLAPAFPTPGLALGRGDFRRLRLTNWRTEENVDAVYWADGSYIDDALAAFDHILRDWRTDDVIRMDPAIIDILSKVHERLDCTEPFEIVSGYRSPKTNATLRRRIRGVARNSYHMRGMAVDVALKSRSVRQMARAGLALQRGGVGVYTRSSFVHLDSGPVRDWGR